MQEPVIVSAVRSPIGKARRGAFVKYRMDDLGALLLKEALARVDKLPADALEDVYCGCAMPEGEQGMNIARIISILAGVPLQAGGMTVNRFCASSMSAIMEAAKTVMIGHGDAVAALGIETMTNVPMGGFNISMNPKLTEKATRDSELPWAYVPMGTTAENLARKYEISREAQDEFSLSSHQKAIKAIDEGWFKDEIVPVEVNGQTIDTDEGPRRDTSLEALAKLKPAFQKDGTVTAGNSSQLSDGAACVIVMSRARAEALGIKPLASIKSFAIAGTDPEYMGIGPVPATRKALERAGLSFDKIEAIELNEAFAAQSLAVLKELEPDPSIVNVHGGAVALGHPLGCSGARIVVSLIGALKRLGKKTGLATMCVGGGQGSAMIVELEG